MHSQMRSAVNNSLAQADSVGARSVDFPALGTGLFGWTTRGGVDCIVKSVMLWLKQHPTSSVEKVHFTDIDHVKANAFNAALHDISSTAQSSAPAFVTQTTLVWQWSWKNDKPAPEGGRRGDNAGPWVPYDYDQNVQVETRYQEFCANERVAVCPIMGDQAGRKQTDAARAKGQAHATYNVKLNRDPSLCKQENSYSGHARPLKREKTQTVFHTPATGTASSTSTSNLDLPECTFRSLRQHDVRPPAHGRGTQTQAGGGGNLLGITISLFNKSPDPVHAELRALLQGELHTSHAVVLVKEDAHLIPKIHQAIQDKFEAAAEIIKLDACRFQLRAFGQAKVMAMYVEALAIKDAAVSEDYRAQSAHSQWWTANDGNQGEQTMLTDVARGTPEFDEVERNFTQHNVKKDLRVFSVQRVQNDHLWKKYTEKRQSIKRDCGDVNETWGIHGTRNTPPEEVASSHVGICTPSAYPPTRSSNVPFFGGKLLCFRRCKRASLRLLLPGPLVADLNYSASGMYGPACYFAVDAGVCLCACLHMVRTCMRGHTCGDFRAAARAHAMFFSSVLRTLADGASRPFRARSSHLVNIFAMAACRILGCWLSH